MFPAGLDTVLAQVFQPYFYYSLILLILSFICVKMFLKYDHQLSRRTRSMAYILPLLIPVLVFGIFHPATTIRTVDESVATRLFILSLSGGSANALSLPPTMFVRLQNIPTTPPLPTFVLAFLPGQTEILSVTGILCLIGLAVALCYSILAIALDDKIVARVFHVIALTQEEYSSLQRNVDELSRRLAIRSPRIGIIEDLRPNAFIAGYGHKTMLVFSVGMLKALDEEELTAVAAHELSHVKKHDFFFKTLSQTLTIVSFFNPFAYFTASAAQREREMLADEEGAKLLDKPKILANALSKTYKALQGFPKEDLLVRLASGLFLVSPIARKPEILATHPNVNQRIGNIVGLTAKTTKARRNVAITVALSFLIILGGLMATYPIVKIQISFVQGQPGLVSMSIPSGDPKFDFVPCLEVQGHGPSELAPLVGFVITQPPNFVDVEKQPETIMLLLNNSYTKGLTEDRVGLDVFRAGNEFEETYLFREIEQVTLRTADVGEGELGTVRSEPWLTEATLNYSSNSRSLGSRLWGNIEPYEHPFLQPQTSTMPSFLWLRTFLGNLAERANSTIKPVSNEPGAFDNTIILLLCSPSTRLAAPYEPVHFFVLLLSFGGNGTHLDVHAIVLAMPPPPIQEMAS